MVASSNGSYFMTHRSFTSRTGNHLPCVTRAVQPDGPATGLLGTGPVPWRDTGLGPWTDLLNEGRGYEPRPGDHHAYHRGSNQTVPRAGATAAFVLNVAPQRRR